MPRSICITARSRNVYVGVLVPDKVDVGDGEVLAHKLPPGVAWLVVPLGLTVLLDQGDAGLVAEAVGADGAVRLRAGVALQRPVVELEEKTLSSLGRVGGIESRPCIKDAEATAAAGI